MMRSGSADARSVQQTGPFGLGSQCVGRFRETLELAERLWKIRRGRLVGSGVVVDGCAVSSLDGGNLGMALSPLSPV
jgi:hypothetical protein